MQRTITNNGSVPTITVEQEPGAAMLDELDTLISELDVAMRDVDAARRELEQARRTMETVEAQILVAGVDGSNETQRRARLTLALLRDPDYSSAEDRARAAAEEQRTAERAVRITSEKIRLLRAAFSLHSHIRD